jgi:hypothetical protein
LICFSLSLFNLSTPLLIPFYHSVFLLFISFSLFLWSSLSLNLFFSLSLEEFFPFLFFCLSFSALYFTVHLFTIFFLPYLTLSCTVQCSVWDVAVGIFNVVSSEFVLLFGSDIKFRRSHTYIWDLCEQSDSEYEHVKIVQLVLCIKLARTVSRASSVRPRFK